MVSKASCGWSSFEFQKEENSSENGDLGVPGSGDKNGDGDLDASGVQLVLSLPALFRPPPAFFFNFPRNRSIVRSEKM